MYYLIIHRKIQAAHVFHRLTAFFFISIFLITFPITAFAEIFDKSAEEYHQKAYEEQQKGNLEQALTYFSKALSLGLRDPKVYNDIGILYEQLGAAQRARDYYVEALQMDSNYLPAYTNLAYSYLEEGDNVRASKYFRKRLEKAASEDPWRETIEQELMKLDPRYKQEQVARQAQELNKELLIKAREKLNLQIARAQKHYGQGQQFYKEGKFKEAILEFKRALSLTPDNPKIVKAHKEAVFQSRVSDVRKRTDSAIKKLENKDIDSAKEQFEDILTNFPSE